MKKRLPFVLFSTLLGVTFAQAQVPKLPEKLEGSIDTSSETSAALFMYNLYSKGLAGGDTGICLDFSNADGKSEIKIGMNTSAFVIGKSELADTKVQTDRMRALLDALAKAQKGPVETSIAGYADGRHYAGENNIQASIDKNASLSKARASTIAGLFKGDSSVKVVSAEGYPSRELESKYPNMSAPGIECGTRRKVVLTVQAKKDGLKSEGEGFYKFTPASYSDDLRDKSRSLAWGAIAQAVDDLSSGSDRADPAKRSRSERKSDEARGNNADEIYNRLLAQGKISKACDQFPLKDLTMALIKSRIDTGSRGNNFEDYLGVQSDPKTRKLMLGKMELVNYGQGSPTVIFACFKADNKWDEGLKTFDKQTGGGVFLSGKQLLAQTGGSNFSDDSQIKVGFDPALMTEEKVGGDRSFGSTRIGKKERGFFCQACGHGFFFEDHDAQGKQLTDAAGKPVFRPIYDDRILKLSLTDQSNPLADALNNLSKTDPLALGSNLKPRMYVVKNCPACNCNPLEALRAQGPNVVTIDPLAEGAKSDFEATMNKKDMDDACVIRPPLWHTCGARPNVVKATKFDAFNGSLKYVDPFTGTTFAVNDLNELVKKIGGSGPAQVACSTTLSPQQKINSVACSGADRSKHLPSEDEKVDCSDEIKAQGAAQAK